MSWAPRFVFALLLVLVLSAWAAGGEGSVDGHFSHRRSSHFVLFQDVGIDRYSGRFGSRRFERDVLEILEDSYDRMAKILGVRPRAPLEVVVYDPEVFQGQFADLFGFRAAGFYHGVIRVQGGSRISTELVRTLQHEYAHAALDNTAPGVVLPAWLNEGVAEYFEAIAVGKRRLSAGELHLLTEASRHGTLPSLAALQGRSFANLGPDRASLAYLKSYAMIEHLARRYGEASLKRFVSNTLRTGNVDGALQRACRRSAADIERDLHAEFR